MPAKGYMDSKYDPDLMPNQIIEMFSRGEDREDFCAFHSISERTFSMWIQKHKAFADAYEIAKQKAKKWFNQQARDHLVEEPQGEKLNTTLWSMMMRNRFELTEHRKIKMEGLKKANSFMEQMQVILGEVAKGNLTGVEAAQMAKLIETGVNVSQHTEMAKRIAELEKADKLGVGDADFKD